MTERNGRRRIYGRRQGHRLSSRQAGLTQTLLPGLRPLSGGGGPLDLQALFGPVCRRFSLEIGFGGGEHLATQAGQHPDTGYIGCEPFINGVAKLLVQVDERHLTNIRIHDDDARDLLERMEDACLDEAFLLFPDPWPKKRHAGRRFVSPENLSQLARVLKDGARLRIASDIPAYIRWTLMHVHRDGHFVWQATRPGDWRIRPSDWPPTRYETKAIAAGRIPSYLTFRRRQRP